MFKTIVFEVILTSLDENKECGKILSINWQNKDLVKLAQNPGGIVAFSPRMPMSSWLLIRVDNYVDNYALFNHADCENL